MDDVLGEKKVKSSEIGVASTIIGFMVYVLVWVLCFKGSNPIITWIVANQFCLGLLSPFHIIWAIYHLSDIYRIIKPGRLAFYLSFSFIVSR